MTNMQKHVSFIFPSYTNKLKASSLHRTDRPGYKKQIKYWYNVPGTVELSFFYEGEKYLHFDPK